MRVNFFRNLLAVLMFAGLFISARSAYGQTVQESTIVVAGYSSAATASANFPSGVFGDRASIVPARTMPYYDPWIGAYDRATYLVIRQAANGEDGTAVSETTGLPLTGGQEGLNTWSLIDYRVSAFTARVDAKAFYDALDGRQKATAYMLSTVSSTSNRWIVVYQILIIHVPI